MIVEVSPLLILSELAFVIRQCIRIHHSSYKEIGGWIVALSEFIAIAQSITIFSSVEDVDMILDDVLAYVNCL